MSHYKLKITKYSVHQLHYDYFLVQYSVLQVGDYFMFLPTHTLCRSDPYLFFFLAEHPWLQDAKKAPNVPLGDVVKSRLKQFSRMNRFKRRALRVCWYFLKLCHQMFENHVMSLNSPNLLLILMEYFLAKLGYRWSFIHWRSWRYKRAF